MKNKLLELIKILEEEKINLYYDKEMVYSILNSKVKRIGLTVLKKNNQGQICMTWTTEDNHEMIGLKYASIYLEIENVNGEKLYYFSYILRNKKIIEKMEENKK